MFFLKELEERDCEKFAKLLIEQFEQEGNKGKISPKQFEARILKCIHSKELTILIAIGGERVKGCIIIHWIQELWTETPEALVSGLYVALDSRNSGIGKALLEEAVQKARNNDCSRLWLENNRNNPIYSKQFYKKRGWNERLDLAIFEFPF